MFLTTPTYPPRYVSSRTQDWSRSLAQRRFAPAPPRLTQEQNDDDLLAAAVRTGAAAAVLAARYTENGQLKATPEMIIAAGRKIGVIAEPKVSREPPPVDASGRPLDPGSVAYAVVMAFREARNE